jgi:hypothetical protein
VLAYWTGTNMLQAQEARVAHEFEMKRQYMRF